MRKYSLFILIVSSLATILVVAGWVMLPEDSVPLIGQVLFCLSAFFLGMVVSNSLVEWLDHRYDREE